MPDKRDIPVDEAEPRPDQPRKQFDPAALLDLGNNMLAMGQLLPIVVYWLATSKRYILVDGERRWRAAKLVGIKHLIAIVLEREPSASQLHQIQMCIEAHRIGLSAMERSEFLSKMKAENNWSISELAEKLNMKQPLVTKLLKFQDGCPEVRAALAAGQIDQDKAYTICQEPDHAKQVELLEQSGDLTREQLRQKARSKGQPLPLKTSVARFELSKETMITVHAPRIDLSGVIEALLRTARSLKKAQAENLDIITAARVMKDQARAAS